jgi:hypothetical protein
MACGCAALGVPTQNGYNQALRTWFGEPTSDLLARWGQPAKRYHNTDGTLMLLYEREDNHITDLQSSQPQLSTQTYAHASDAGGELYAAVKRQQEFQSVLATDRCLTLFAVDSAGIIRQIEWTGNACRAVPPTGTGPEAWSASARPLVSSHALGAGGPS